MSFMQKFSKAIDKAGKQTSKAIVKGKIMAIQKIAHANATPELPEIIGALERLKATKNEISTMADVARYLYEARINQATYQINLSHNMRDARTAEGDGWGKLCVTMGSAMSRLESIHSEHCEKMKEEFVAPLEKFRDVDIAEVQKLKLKYKEAKSAYDVAAAKEQSAKDSGQAAKMQQAFAKKQETEQDLKKMRTEFLKAVEGLERQKNTELLGLVLDYWKNYVQFAKAQHNALQAQDLPEDIDPTNYVGGSFEATTPGAVITDENAIPQTNYNEYPNGDEKKNETNDTGGINNEYGSAGIHPMGGEGGNGNDYNNNDNNDNNNNTNDMFVNENDDDNNNTSYNQNGSTNPFGNDNDGNYDNDAMANGDINTGNNLMDNSNDNDNNNNNNNIGGPPAVPPDAGAPTTNPFDDDSDPNYEAMGNGNGANNGGGNDPMDFDPYEQPNANNNQNAVGGQSIASSQGGFI